jgi:hypothetical protein
MISGFRNSFLALMEKVYELRQEPYKCAHLLLEIQIKLIRRIKYLERRIRATKAAAATDETLWEQVEQYRRALNLFRMIGDCIAFTYINRWDVKPFAHGHDSGFISGKRGFGHELKIMRAVASTLKVPCLLSDLTNVLKYGDLYAFRAPRPLAIIEIKSPTGRKDHRLKRQMKRLNNLTEFLATDFSLKHYRHGNPTYRIDWSGTPTYYIREARDVLSNGIQTGFALQKLQPGLYYAALRTDGLTDRLNELHQFTRTMHTPVVCVLNEGILDVDDYPYYPLLLSIPDSANVFQLFLWKIVFMVILDAQQMRSFYEERNIGFDFSTEDKKYVAALKFPAGTTKFDDNEPIWLSRQFFGRVGREFLSLRDWMEQTIKIATDSKFDNLPAC